MIARSVSRIAASLTILLSLGLALVPLLSQSVHASSITLKWADPFDDKVLFIEAGGTRLFEEKLAGDSLKVEAAKILQEGVPYTAAIVSLEGFDELAIGVNLFRCSVPCEFRITFAAFDPPHSRSVGKICQTNPKPVDSQFKKYFFCRAVVHRNSAANGGCWPETLSALTGWFEAAYKLHELTLRDGIGFVARDLEIEGLINELPKTCPQYKSTIKRNPGYFKGMIQNLDIAVLQQTQRVQQSLAADKPEEAKGLAEQIVQQLDAAEPIRNAISFKDAAFVESVVNRALVRDTQFILR